MLYPNHSMHPFILSKSNPWIWPILITCPSKTRTWIEDWFQNSSRKLCIWLVHDARKINSVCGVLHTCRSGNLEAIIHSKRLINQINLVTTLVAPKLTFWLYYSDVSTPVDLSQPKGGLFDWIFNVGDDPDVCTFEYSWIIWRIRAWKSRSPQYHSRGLPRSKLIDRVQKLTGHICTISVNYRNQRWRTGALRTPLSGPRRLMRRFQAEWLDVNTE